MEVLLGQLPLIAFLVFYYFYGARLVGALLAAALRPSRGLEARPPYWEGGIAVLFMALGLWMLTRSPTAGVWLFLLAEAVGVMALLDWSRRRLWLRDGELHAQGLWGPPKTLPLGAIQDMHVSGGYSLVIERVDGQPAVRAPLSMDGLDGIYAALMREGVKGPAFDRFQSARKSQRRR